MPRLLKVGATAVVIASCAVVLRAYVIVPWRCDVALHAATLRVEGTISLDSDETRAAMLARSSAGKMKECVDRDPGNVAAQMVLAACYRVLKRYPDAAAAYETALVYDRRPELYLNLGQTQLAMGDSKRAVQNLTLACIYQPALLNEIDQYHDDVKHAVDLYQTQLQAAH